MKRDVAIRVLPPLFASDADRLARFQREAEVLASLNHANIAHIYGIERGDGTSALAMELVEGETLAQRIARGPIAMEEALRIARCLASDSTQFKSTRCVSGRPRTAPDNA